MKRKMKEAPTPEPFAKPEELFAHIPYLVSRLASSWNAELGRRLESCGITTTMLRALSLLHIFRTLTVNEIAELAIAEQSSASRAVDQLVVAGLVERRISQTDQRRREVVLSKRGESLLRGTWPIMTSGYARLAAGIDPEALATTARTLVQMMENMRRDGPP